MAITPTRFNDVNIKTTVEKKTFGIDQENIIALWDLLSNFYSDTFGSILREICDPI